MDPLTSFKLAFISRCLDEGLTLAQMNERVKTAIHKLEKQADNETLGSRLAKGLGTGITLNTLGASTPVQNAGAALAATGYSDWILNNAPKILAATGIAATGSGILAGKALADMRSDPLAEQEAKAEEVINDLAIQKAKIRMKNKLRRLKESGGI
jgi:hypothetical protein